MSKNEKKYIISKMLNGKYSFLTLYYCFLHKPYLLPFLLLVAFRSLFIAASRVLVQRKNKFVCEKKFKAFTADNSSEKVSKFIKPIALYLPQFHEIPENNKWWGEGFTEWVNVKKAKPLFEGHYQPHIPHADLGYYDLSDVNVMRKQAQMAKDYGLYGFCFYYYYFSNGTRLLETPINNYLNAKDIDFPFCFAWANENWTRIWDGGDNDIIMPQDYDEKNMLKMIEGMIEAFKDSRYIKHNNKPVLMIYRAEIIPKIQELVEKWRDVIRKSGFDDLYLVSMQNFEEIAPKTMGFDAATEFAPKAPNNRNYVDGISVDKMQHLQKMSLIQYSRVVDAYQASRKVDYTRYSCVCPAWDNTPRKGDKKSTLLLGAKDELFEEFYVTAVKNTLTSNAKDAGFLFINAWNEWGEGAHLEPDLKNGYASLEIIKKIQNKDLKEVENEESYIL